MVVIVICRFFFPPFSRFVLMDHKEGRWTDGLFAFAFRLSPLDRTHVHPNNVMLSENPESDFPIRRWKLPQNIGGRRTLKIRDFSCYSQATRYLRLGLSSFLIKFCASAFRKSRPFLFETSCVAFSQSSTRARRRPTFDASLFCARLVSVIAGRIGRVIALLNRMLP